MENICYIVGAGSFFEKDTIALKQGDLLIAADGGYEYVKDLSPSIFIGDYDSCSSEINAKETILLPKEKDDTDMAAALKEGIKRGYKKFLIYGGTGGRISHTFANVQCLLYLASKDCEGWLFDENSAMTVIKNSHISFDSTYNGYCSVFSLCDHSYDVTISGMKYPLKNAILTSSHPIGISNEFTGVKSNISVGEGELLIIFGRNNFKI